MPFVSPVRLERRERYILATFFGFSGGLFPIFRKYFQNLGKFWPPARCRISTKSLFTYDLSGEASYGIGIA
jgi:hypothetical protein